MNRLFLISVALFAVGALAANEEEKYRVRDVNPSLDKYLASLTPEQREKTRAIWFDQSKTEAERVKLIDEIADKEFSPLQKKLRSKMLKKKEKKAAKLEKARSSWDDQQKKVFDDVVALREQEKSLLGKLPVSKAKSVVSQLPRLDFSIGLKNGGKPAKGN